MPQKKYTSASAARKPVQSWIQGLCLLAIIALIDDKTGYELNFLPLYLLPVFLISWNGNLASGIAIVVITTAVWVIVDIKSGQLYSSEFFRYWNSLIRFFVHGVVALLVVKVHTLLDKETRAKQALTLAYDELKDSQERLLAETAARLETLQQLRHADRLKTVGRLAAGIAHELGTPLSVISGRTQFILAESSSNSSLRRNATIIGEQTSRISSIVQQLLDFARHHKPRLAPFDLRVTVGQTLDMLRPLGNERGASLVSRVPEEPVTARMDAAQIQQVLMNLIINAVQAMPDGGTVTVEARRSAARSPFEPEGSVRTWASFSVTDEGEGIAPEQMGSLFEPFFTTRDTGQGTGLGLSIAHGIVSEHGGWIDVESQPGKGSRFSVYLPLED